MIYKKDIGVSNDLNYIKGLELLSRSSIFLLKNSSKLKLFSYIADTLYKLTGAIVTIGEYNQETNTITMWEVKLSTNEKNFVERILGFRLKKMKLPFHEDTRKKFISGKLAFIPGGLYELSFYTIPKVICSLIEKTLNIGNIYAMAFVVDKDFLGTISFMTHTNTPLKNTQLAEAFINQSAIALQRLKTENQLLETMNKLENEKKRLQQLEHKKDEFINIASHELKTPLTSIKIYAQLMDKQLNTSTNLSLKKTKSLNSRLLKDLSKIEKLINDMLDVSRIVKGKLIYNWSEINLDSLINETIDSFQLMYPSHNIMKTGHYKNNIRGDMNRLQQVIINLLTNAIKYSPNSNKVIIKIQELHEDVLVTIRDFGIGISKKNSDKIFEPYFRINDHAQSGLGLGLYISAEIIKRHGGKIWVESKKGKGSRFCFTLPKNI